MIGAVTTGTNAAVSGSSLRSSASTAIAASSSIARTSFSKARRPSPAPRRTLLAAEDADDFEMRAVPELVHRRDALEAVAAGGEDCGIAHEGPGIAGDADDDRDFCRGELLCLCLRPGARGIDHE